MNGAFVHLAFNHVPVIGLPLAVLVLAGGLWRKSRDLTGAGFALAVLIAAATVVAFKSGGKAAHAIIGIPGIEKSAIHEHAKAADYGFWGVEFLGFLALFGLRAVKNSGQARGLAVAVVLGGLFVSAIMARVAHLGGLIRHPEVSFDFTPPPPPPPPLAPRVHSHPMIPAPPPPIR